MAFPEDPLGLNIEIRPARTWVNITGKVKTSVKIAVSRGIRNNGVITDPATVPMKIDTKDGELSPRNPMGPYWGQLGLNTPVRLWIPGGPHFLDLDGDPANYASTPDVSALDITGDLDIRAEADVSWFDPTANQVLIQKWDAPGGQRSYSLRVNDQLLNFNWSANGVTNEFAARPLPALPPRAAVRATLDVNDGSGQYVVRLYWAPSMDGPWEQLGTDRVGPATSVFSGTAPLRVGGYDPTVGNPRTPFEGKGYRFEVRNGINGTVVAAPDFTAQPLGAAGFTDSAGRVWSYSGAAMVADRQEIVVAEIPEWPQDWVPSAEAVWAEVEAAGILRRYGQGQKALDSTLRRRIPSANPIAYWPMEEDTAATRAYSPVTGVRPAAVTGVEWASVDTLPSSRPLPRLTAAATLSAIVPAAADGQWQVECVYNADDKAPPEAGVRAEVLAMSSTGTIRRWVISMRKGSAHLAGYDVSGTAVVSSALTATEDIFHGWYRLRFYVQDLGGGQMEWVLGWANVSGATMQLAKTITATAGHVTAVTANWGPLTEGWSIGHLSVMREAANVIYDGSDSAYSGETAWDRMRRLAIESGIPIARIPGLLVPERVGPQKPEQLLDLFKAAAAADGGMLLEDRTRLGLVYRDRSSLYTQEPALTLAYGKPGLAPPFKPTNGDKATRNDRTIGRDGGSSAQAVLKEGRLSIQDPPDGIGLYDDSQTLSLADDTQTEPVAYWQLHLGTDEGDRYTAITVRLHRAPWLIPAVLAMREGDLIRVTDLPGFVSYGDVDALVTGWTDTLLPRTWERTFVCTPGSPWNVAKADHPTYGKAMADGCEIAQAVLAGDTAVPLRTTAGDQWVTANPVLNANPHFGEDLASWTAFAAAIARVPVPLPAPFRNPWCMEITPDGVGQYPNSGSEQIPVVPGLDYVLSGWLRCATARDVALNANWFNGVGGYLATGDNTQTVQAGVWTWFEKTFTAPVGAVTANLAPTVPDFPPSTDVLLATKVTLRRVGGMPREFPIDLAFGGEVVRASAIERRTLNTNPELIVNATGWTGQNGSAVRSTAVVHPDAVASLLITPNGSSASGGATCALSAVGSVVPGRQYTVSLWAYSPAGWSNLQPCVDWNTAAGAFISSSLGAGSAVPAATWTFLTQTFTAPATAARGTMRARHGGTPGSAAIWYAWDIRLDAVGEQVAAVQRSLNGVTKPHVAGAPVQVANRATAAL